MSLMERLEASRATAKQFADKIYRIKNTAEGSIGICASNSGGVTLFKGNNNSIKGITFEDAQFIVENLQRVYEFEGEYER